jgi:hypothetical protein
MPIPEAIPTILTYLYFAISTANGLAYPGATD